MSTLKSPEELNEPSFTLESNLELSDLIQTSKCLLSYLSFKLKQLFYLVVFFKEKASVRIVKDYITTTRLNVSPEDEAPFIIDYKETEKDTKHLIFVHTFLTVNLLKKSVVNQENYPDIVCKAKVVLFKHIIKESGYWRWNPEVINT
ncbi:hypothetical protein RhiirA4_480326 [Rhizophagus irregularis]|uniref:Uncharacterized protein n=1 Tax=Rhizophagus irregularis TaxID=588596 RepID=A0A2I1HHR9_9GLOM|nr:hypothetical protein RhiirA4_480326 [Rhizophagus irregularis]